MADQKRPVFLYWKKGDPASMEPVDRGGAGAVVLGERKKKYIQGTKKSRRKSMNERPRTPSGKGGFNQETRLETDNAAAQHQKLATLCELCPEDKRRVRQLVEQLAVVGAEKEQLEKQIFDDRHQFSDLLTKLKAHHQKVLEERQRVVDELQSSQLQLQDLHTYPTLPVSMVGLVQSQTPSSSVNNHPLLNRTPSTISTAVLPPSTSSMRSLSTTVFGHMTPVKTTSLSQGLPRTGNMTSANSTSLPQGLPYADHMTSQNSTSLPQGLPYTDHMTSQNSTSLPQGLPYTDHMTSQNSTTLSKGIPSNNHMTSTNSTSLSQGLPPTGHLTQGLSHTSHLAQGLSHTSHLTNDSTLLSHSLPHTSWHETNERGTSGSTRPIDDWQSLSLATPTVHEQGKNFEPLMKQNHPEKFSVVTPSAPSAEDRGAADTQLHVQDLQTTSTLHSHDVPTQTESIASISTQTDAHTECIPPVKHPPSLNSSSLSVSDLAPPTSVHLPFKPSTTQGRHAVSKPQLGRKILSPKVKGRGVQVRVQGGQDSFLLPTKLHPPSPNICDGTSHVQDSVERGRGQSSLSRVFGDKSHNGGYSLNQTMPEGCPRQPGSQRRSSQTQTSAQLDPDISSSMRGTVAPGRNEHTSGLSSGPSPTQSRLYSTNSSELDSLLATALLNAEHTLNAIRTLSTSVHCERSEMDDDEFIVAAPNGSIIGTTGSLGTETRLANGTKSNKSLTNSPLEQRNRSTTTVDSKTHSRTTGQRKAVGSTGNCYQSPSPANVDIVSVLNLPPNGDYPRDDTPSLLSDRYTSVPVTGSKVKLKANNPFFTSEHSKTREMSDFKLRPTSGKKTKQKPRRSVATSTPCFEDTRDSEVQRLRIFDSQLGSTVRGECSQVCSSEVFEHAHSLAQRLHKVDNTVDNSFSKEIGHSEHAQLLSQKLHTVDNSIDNNLNEGSHRYSEHAQLLSRRLHTVDNVMLEDESHVDQYNDYYSEESEMSRDYDTSINSEDSTIIEELFFIS